MKALNKVMDVIRLSMQSLSRHPGRSALTAMGVIFGVLSVITMLAIMEGASQRSQRLLRELGSDNIIIEAVKLEESSSASNETARVFSYGLKFDDVDRLRSIPGVRRCVVARRTQKSAYYDGMEVGVEVIATEPDYAKVARVEMTAGRFLTSTDVVLKRKVCVMTQPLARKLFGLQEPIGKEIDLTGDAFVVVGIVPHLPGAMTSGEGNPDQTLIVPFSTQIELHSLYTTIMVTGSFKRELAEINQVILQMTDEQAVEYGAVIAARLLRMEDPQRRDFRMRVPRELIAQQRAQQMVWNIAFGAIAGVSLLVGGIGIVNIMLANVTERTREIGIRRALGGKQRDIIAQFLTEAVMLTITGCAIGVAGGFLVPFLVRITLGMEAVLTTVIMIFPFAMAVVVGLVSGIYPARRAAKLDPIVARRHEERPRRQGRFRTKR